MRVDPSGCGIFIMYRPYMVLCNIALFMYDVDIARNQGVKTEVKIIHAFSNQLDAEVFTSEQELPSVNGVQK